LVAAQIAYYYNDYNAALGFLERGFDWGLMPFHIIRCPVFRKEDTPFFKNVLESFKRKRNQYLARINPEVIEKVLDIRWTDQLFKTINPTYSITNNGKSIILDSITAKIMREVIELTKKYGFPGQKVIGIVHNGILQELGRDSAKDLPIRYKNFAEKEFYRIPKGVGELNDFTYLSNEVVLIALYHHPCAFQELTNEVLLQAIRSGNLYPNDYGLLYTAQYCKCFASFKRVDSALISTLCPPEEPYNGGYAIGVAYDLADSNRINSNREKIGMRSICHQRKMIQYANDRKIIIGFGMMETK
jgi:hypothetical protein